MVILLLFMKAKIIVIILTAAAIFSCASKVTLPAQAENLVLIKQDYRIYPNHKTDDQIQQDILGYYKYWKSNYVQQLDSNKDGSFVVADSTGSHYVPIKSNSEAHGYGMLISVILKDKAVFDSFNTTRKMFPSKINKNLMSWVIPESEKPGQGGSCATDGDMDMAFALFLASESWPEQKDEYLDQANQILKGVEKSLIAKKTFRVKLGDWDKSSLSTRSSDWMLSHFRLFGIYSDSGLWGKVIDEIQFIIKTIQNNYSQKTGLIPDFISRKVPEPASAFFLEGKHDGHYFYNACRVPMRLAMDYHFSKNKESKTAAAKIIDWIIIETKNNPAAIKPGYSLEGESFENYKSAAFISPMVCAAITDEKYQDFLNKGYETCIKLKQSYYEDSLTMLSLLVISGYFPTLN